MQLLRVDKRGAHGLLYTANRGRKISYQYYAKKDSQEQKQLVDLNVVQVPLHDSSNVIQVDVDTVLNKRSKNHYTYFISHKKWKRTQQNNNNGSPPDIRLAGIHENWRRVFTPERTIWCGQVDGCVRTSFSLARAAFLQTVYNPCNYNSRCYTLLHLNQIANLSQHICAK